MLELDQKNELFIEHNINPVVLELFYEYVICVTNYMFATYLGDKYYNHYTKNKKDKKIEDHFMFCMFNADSRFESLGYIFFNDPRLASLLLAFFEDNFYEAEKDNPSKLKQVILNKLSYIHVQGGLSDAKLKNLKEMYSYFLQSFKKQMN